MLLASGYWYLIKNLTRLNMFNQKPVTSNQQHVNFVFKLTFYCYFSNAFRIAFSSFKIAAN